MFTEFIPRLMAYTFTSQFSERTFQKTGIGFARASYFVLVLFLLGLVLTGEARGQITQRGTATTSTSTGTLMVIGKPTGLQVGDLMLATIHQTDNDNDFLSSATPSTGWTLIDGSRYYTSGNNEWRVDFYYKIATVTDVAGGFFTFSGDSDADDMQGAIIAFSGVDTTTPFDVAPGNIRTNGNSSTVTANSITTVSDNAAVVMLAATADNRSFSGSTWSTTSPNSLSETFDVPFNADLDMGIGGAWEIKANPGATGNGTVTLSGNTRSGAILLALRPASCSASPNAGPALSSICQGGTSAALGGSVGGSATGGIWSDGGIGGTFSPSATNLNATWTPPSNYTGTATLTLTSTGGTCSDTDSKTIVVNANPTASAGSPLAPICQGQQSLAMGGSVGGGAAGGTWSGGTGTWTNANNPSTARYTAGPSESGVIILTLTTTGGSCGTVTATKPIIVNPSSTANSGGALAAICPGETSAAMGGSIGGAAIAGVWSGGTGTWTNSHNPATATYTAGPSESGTITLTLTAIGGSCGTTSVTKNITINPNKSASTPASTTVCAVSGTVSLSHTTTGVTGIGTATGLPAGVTASFSGGIITVSGSPTELGTFNYSIPLVGTCGPAANATGTIIVENCACVETYDSDDTWTVPAGVTSIIVEAWGGGGRGGGRSSGSGAYGGGGGGAYSVSVITVNAGQTYTFEVGEGSTSTAAGGTSRFYLTSGTDLVRAAGGNSVTNNDSGGAEGGSADDGVGDNRFSGGNGADSGSNGGGGGSSAGSSSDGTDASGSSGATAPTDGGDGANGRTSSSGNGGDATEVGGGGGGARRSSGGGSPRGGYGADGQIKITFITDAGVINGNSSICLGSTTTFTSTQSGGTWSSSNESVATVDANTGVITALGVGAATIRYTLIGVCAVATSTRTIFVNQSINPGTLSGNQEICIGGTSQFSSTTSSGTWSSDNPAIATVSSTGLVTGLTAGTTTIRYTLPASGGCPPSVATRTITVTTPPVAGTLSGTQEVCVAGTTAFSSTSSGGIWSSGNPSIATVNSVTGVVTGIAPGTAILTYTVAGTGGCAEAYSTLSVTVTAAPNAGTISGSSELCVGDDDIFLSTEPDGKWSSSNGAIASVDSSTGQVIGISPGTATITYRVSGSGGCADATATRTVTINALPNPSFTAEPTSTVCVNEEVTYATQTGQFDYDWDIEGDEGTDYSITSGGTGATSHSVSLVWLTEGPKEVSVNYSNTNGCPADNFISNIVTVNPLPVPTFTAEPSNPICIGDEVTYTTQAGQVNYSWAIPGTAGTDYNITAGGIGTSSNTVTIEWLTDGSKTVTVNYESTDGCSVATPASNTIDLAPLPVPTFAAEPSDPVCIGDQVTYTTQAGQSDYSWTVSGTEGTDYTIRAGGVGTNSNTVTIEWLTDGSKTVMVNYSDANGCTGISPASNTINLDPLPVPTFVTEPSNPVCIGDQVTYTTQDSQFDYAWTVTGTVGTDYNITAGGIGSSNNTVTIEWLTDGSKTVTVNYMDANGCSIPSPASNTIEVSIYTSIDTQPDNTDQLECFGDGFDPISVSATGSNLSYQWYKKPDNSDIGTNPGTAVPGATSATFTPPSTPEGISYYYVVVTGNCGTETSDLSGQFIVDPSGTLITDDPDVFDETVCFGGSFSQLEVAALGDGGSAVTYQWYQNTSPDNTGGVVLSGENNSTFTPPADASLADGLPRYYYATASSSCGTVPTAISGAFTVNPLTEITSEILGGDTICEGDGPFDPISVTAIGTGTLSYQWYSNTTGVIDTGVDAQVGTDSDSFTPPSNVADGVPVYYYVVVSSTGGCGPDQTSSISGGFVVNALPVPTFTTAPAADVCEGTSVTYTTESGQSNYSWSVPGTDGTDYTITAGGIGTSNNTVTLTWLTAGAKDVSVNYTNANNCTAAMPVTNSIEVDPLPVPTFTTAPAADVCEGTSVTYTTEPGQSNYSWSVPGTDGTDYTITSGGIGTSNNTITLTWLTAGTKDVSVNYTNANNCTAPMPVTNSIEVNPLPMPTFTSAPAADVCEGTSVTYTTEPGQSNYSWSLPGTDGTDYTITAGGIGTSNNTVTLTWLTAGAKDVSVNYTNANNCTAAMPVTNSIEVDPFPVPTFTTAPAADVCQGTSVTYTTEPGQSNYIWSLPGTDGTDYSITSGGIGTASNTVTLTWLIAGTKDVSVNYTNSNNCTAATPVTNSIEVNPVPEIVNINGTTICSGDSFTVTPEDGTNGEIPMGTTYTWAVTNSPNVTGETNQASPQSSISQTLTNTSIVDQTLTYTVTPITPEGCTGNTFEVEVTIRPTPTVDPISDQAAVCSGTPSTAVNFTGNGVSGVVYNWTNDNPSIGLSASGTGDIPTFITENTSPGPITATITVTPTANGCSGPSESFTITVDPSPEITLLADYCAVGGSVQLVASSNVTGTTWLWSTGETTSTVLVDLAGLYSVTATSPNGCTSTASISVAEELVVDGSFTNFNASSPSFFTEYTQNQNYFVDGDGSTGLWPEGYYAVNVNAYGSTTTDPPGYHTYFYGRDHTNNATGARNFMMVNGGTLIGSPARQPVIWQQTITVEPYTEYYFSAWAMNLNPGSPAKLQFKINGQLVGTVLDLSTAPTPTSDAEVGLDNWREFRSDPSWSSGSATSALIEIVNLNPALSGNDFALDDISFGTLSPFIKLTSVDGTDDSQVVCQDSPIVDIEYAVGGGLAGPIVENLPPGVTSVWNGVNLRISGSPTTPGTYNYTVYTTGACVQVRSEGTIIVRDTPTEGTIASDQTVCSGDIPATIVGDVYAPQEAGAVVSYRWEMNTELSNPNWLDVSGNPSGADYDPPVLTETTQYRRYTISTVNGLSCEGPVSDPVTITLQSEPITGTIATDQTICEGDDPVAFTSTSDGTGDGDISYRWEFRNSSNTTWTSISGATGATYDSPVLTETTEFRRITISSLNGVDCESSPTSPVTVTVTPSNTVAPVNPDPTLCFDTPQPVTIIHTSTGATGIANEGVAGANGLPLGVSAAFDTPTGNITISGTPTEVGAFNYSIPLTGGCGAINATGTITVDNPTYPIINIDVVNPAEGSFPPYTSTFTVYSDELTIGTYEINYSLSGANVGPDQTISVNVTTPGEFTFVSEPYTNEGTTYLTINSIREVSDLCPYDPPNNNTVPFGISCSSERSKDDGDATFTVPADVYQVTIEVYGDGLGGNTDSQTVDVQPGGQIFLVFDGTDIFATEVPDTRPMANRLAQAIVATTGPNGRIVVTYDCTPPPPCSGSGDVFQYTDSEGYTIIRFTGDCSWTSPNGLDEFEVLVVGGGGGGGFGEAAGGGGGGAVIYQKYTGITTNGLPGLEGAIFQITPGGQGLGAASRGQQGENGESSAFEGPNFEYSGNNTFSDLAAMGGGGGGTSGPNPSVRNGRGGASGGGGAAFGNENSAGGPASNGNGGGSSNGQSFGASGAGGGGVAGNGSSGSGNVNHLVAGSGGNGLIQAISGEDVYYGAGGGGTSSGAIVNEPGMGGSQYIGAGGAIFYAGGRGNNNGKGLPATTFGSGGGAGKTGGSNGFQGVVYVRYPNFRILPVDYLYFKVEYNTGLRSGDLKWSTAKEWGNSHFEIERSVNTVNGWEKIGVVDGAGYSDGPMDYAYRDTQLPLAGGDIFYRLKQIDFDGGYTYSAVKAIRVEPMPGITYFRVYPNPTSGYPFEIELMNPEVYRDEPITLRIISATGQYETFHVDGLDNMGMQISEWLMTKAAGVYTLEISWRDKQEYHKVILKR